MKSQFFHGFSICLAWSILEITCIQHFCDWFHWWLTNNGSKHTYHSSVTQHNMQTYSISSSSSTSHWKYIYLFANFVDHTKHEMKPIVINDPGACQSVHLSVAWATVWWVNVRWRYDVAIATLLATYMHLILHDVMHKCLRSNAVITDRPTLTQFLCITKTVPLSRVYKSLA